VGDIAGETGNVNLGDIKINTRVNNENDEKKPAPETGRTTNITNTKQIGDITGAVHGDVTIGDHTYNINLKYSDIEDEVMKDLADSKLTLKTEADSDYHKLSDSKKEDTKNKMRDALDKEKAEYMKSMPTLMEKDYTLEQRKSAEPEIRAKIQAGLEADAERFLKELQAGQVPLFERLMKGGDADARLQSEPCLKQGDTLQHQDQTSEDRILPSRLAKQIEMPQPANSDDLFIGGRGKFMQWSVSQ
jgi:hypothetical protein